MTEINVRFTVIKIHKYKKKLPSDCLNKKNGRNCLNNRGRNIHLISLKFLLNFSKKKAK